MGSRKRAGMVRRPIEYALVAVAILLIGVLLWTVSLLNKEVDRSFVAESSEEQARPLTGTVEEIDWLAEYDIKEERAADILQRTRDQKMARATDAAADNFGSVYDENTLPANICTQLDEQTAKYTQKFDSLLGDYQKARAAQLAARSEQITSMQTDVSASRSKRDLDRANSYELLRQSTDDGFNELVATYVSQIDGAVAVRREAFDSARTAYVTAVERFLETRDATITNGQQHFRAVALASLASVNSECKSKAADEGVIRSKLVQELSAARLAYADVLRARTDYEEEVRSAEAAKNTHYNESVFMFEQAVRTIQEAHAALKR